MLNGLVMTIGYNKYHYIKDEVNAKHVMLQYVPTEDNLADIFTKPLARVRFNRLRGPMMGTHTSRRQNVD